MSSASHKWASKKLTKPAHCSYCKQFNWERTHHLCRVCGRSCHEKCALLMDAQKIPCSPESNEDTPAQLTRTASLDSIPPVRPRTQTTSSSLTTSQSIIIPQSKAPPIRPVSTMIASSLPSSAPDNSSRPTSTYAAITPITENNSSTSIPPSSNSTAPSTPSTMSTPATSPTAQSSDTGIPVAEGIFSALPVRAASFQSGRVRITTIVPNAEFAHPFAQRPRVCAWIMTGGTGLTRIPTEQLVITPSGFKITTVTSNCAVNWIAYLTPATNPFLSDTIKFVFATPGLTPVLIQKVEKCVEVSTVNGAASDGQTLLHAAAYSGHLDLVNWLLKKPGINVDVQDERGWTPLMCAVHPGHFAVAFRLLSQGASVSIVNNRKHTALHLLARSYAQEKNSEEVVRILIGSGNDLNRTSETGETALMIACSGAYNHQFVTMLLEASADPNIPDMHGATPLYKATMSNTVGLAEILLKYGADPNKGPEGDTPFDRARASGNTVFIDMFERAAVVRKDLGRMTIRGKLFSGWMKNTSDLGTAIQMVSSNSNFAAAGAGLPPVLEDFSSTLEKSECRELRSMVEAFTKAFSKNKYTREEEADAVKQFFNDMEGAMKDHPLWANLQPAQFDVAQEGMRSLIFTKMYNQLFNKKEMATKDAALCKHISALSSLVTPQNMHLREDLDFDLISSAERELQAMDNVITPEEKLICILNCCKILVAVLQAFGSAAGADDFLPLFIFAVMEANLPHLYSNLDFIEYFKDEKRKNTEGICFFTHLCCAAAYIETDVTEEYLIANGASASASASSTASSHTNTNTGTTNSTASVDSVPPTTTTTTSDTLPPTTAAPSPPLSAPPQQQVPIPDFIIQTAANL
ncbi:vacuolar assembly/sorting protein VPS9 [Pelomyxa schiedti]|nr:vacuolar assembly/sorting protein VPS9 [Pelomyxa schiedti]